MGSKNPPVNLYDPAMLATVEQAFDFDLGGTSDPLSVSRFRKGFGTQTALGQKLLTLAAEGVTDPVELREWALESSLLG